MNKVRQIMLEQEKTSRRDSNCSNCVRNNSFMIHKINSSNIQPYALYPIIENARNRSGSIFVANKHLTHSDSSSKPKKTEIDQARPKTYQRLSLYRAKAKQLSSYAGRAFSLSDRSQEYGSVVIGVAKRPSAFRQTLIIPKLHKYQRCQQYEEFTKLPSVVMQREVADRKLSDKRMGYIRKWQKPCVANLDKAEKQDNLWILNSWQTFQTAEEE